MDLIDPHVAAETAHYVAATLATYADDLGLDDALSHAKARHERQRIGKDQPGAKRLASDS